MPRPTSIPAPSDANTVKDDARLVYEHRPPSHATDQQNVKTTVGNPDDSTAFYPYVRYGRWDDECWIELQLKYNPDAFQEEVEDDGNGNLIWRHSTVVTRFYPLDPANMPDAWAGDIYGHGGYEFDVYLESKPPQNSVSFDIARTGCDMWYQPDAATQAVALGMDVGDIDIPADNVGSYVVMATNKAHNKYGCGVMCHLTRPKAIDNTGDWIYCDLNDDAQQTGVLTITINQQWMNQATYPVVIDPTAGWTTKGATGYVMNASEARVNNASGSNDDSTGSLSNDATVDTNGMYLCCYRISNGGTIKTAIYTETGTLSTDTFVVESTTLATNSISATDLANAIFEQFDVSNQSLSSGTSYKMASIVNNGSKARYAGTYTGSSADYNYATTGTNFVFDTNLTSYATSDIRLSQYFSYTESAGSTRRVMVVS